jgi:hypothetical protein
LCAAHPLNAFIAHAAGLGARADVFTWRKSIMSPTISIAGGGGPSSITQNERAPLLRHENSNTGNGSYVSISIQQPPDSPMINFRDLPDGPRFVLRNTNATGMGAAVGATFGLAIDLACRGLGYETHSALAPILSCSSAVALLANRTNSGYRHRSLQEHTAQVRKGLNSLSAKCRDNRHGWAIFRAWVNEVANPDMDEFATRPKYIVEKLADIFEAAGNSKELREQIYALAGNCDNLSENQVAAGFYKMVNTVHAATKATNAPTAEFLEYARIAFTNHTLHNLAAVIARKVHGEGAEHAIKVYTYFASQLASDLQLTDEIARPMSNWQIGTEANLYGYTNNWVTKKVLTEVHREGGLQNFLTSGAWPHWASHVQHRNAEHFQKIEETYKEDRSTNNAGASTSANESVGAIVPKEIEDGFQRESREKLTAALTDHYFSSEPFSSTPKDFESFDFNAWFNGRSDAWTSMKIVYPRSPWRYNNLLHGSNEIANTLSDDTSISDGRKS